MKEVRWGIIGTGFIANTFAQAITCADGAKLVAVASRKEETAKAFAKKCGVDTWFASYEELLDFAGIDAVYVALPHIYHPIYAKKAMLAGKHVLCEKPICVNEKQLQELCRIQKEKNVFLMEAMWTRFHPVMESIHALIAKGVIGEVREVSADFCYNLEDPTNMVYKKEQAGGSLLDVGIYGLTFASIFLGDDVADIKQAVYRNQEGIDERIHVLLTYQNGNIARISSALSLFKPEDGYIYGSKGYIRVPRFYGCNEYEVYTDAGMERVSVPYKGNGYTAEIEECSRCIVEGKTESAVVPLKQSMTILRWMDTIRKQADIIYEMDE